MGPDGRRGDLSTKRAEVAQLHETFPDIEMTIEDTLSDSDTVTFRYTLRGTHTGDSFRGIEPTGESFAVKGIAFVTLSDNRVTRYELVMDTLGMVEQLR